MILEMKVPSPGESITEVEIATWLVSDGDYVEKDQAIAEVDSDKATLELPAEASGIITLKAEEGDAVAVGQVVCLIDTSAEAPEGGSSSTDQGCFFLSPFSISFPTIFTPFLRTLHHEQKSTCTFRTKSNRPTSPRWSKNRLV